MKSFDSELKKYTEKVSLKASERHQLRERVSLYMEYHPLQKPERVSKNISEALPFDPYFVLNFNTRIVRIAGGFFALLIIAIPFAAERSVPGDVLYLVKTNITESVQGQLANSPYEKIEFETRLMEKRIAEARVLKNEGRLTDDVKTQIAETVKEHSEAVQDGIAELRVQDADGAAIAQIAYSSSLEVQSAMLGTQESGDSMVMAIAVTMMAKTMDATLVDPILSVVTEAQAEVANDQNATIPSFNGLVARIELETTRAYELFEAIKQTATAEEITDLERRLSDMNRVVGEAKALQTSDETFATNELAASLKQIQKLILFMTDINVRETIALETIVPIVPSDEERIAFIQTELQAVEEIEREIEQYKEGIDDADTLQKISEGIDMITEFRLNTLTSLDIADIEGAEFAVMNARMYAQDVLYIVSPQVDDVIPVDIGEVIEAEAETVTTTESTIESEESIVE